MVDEEMRADVYMGKVFDGCSTVYEIHRCARRPILEKLRIMGIDSIRLFPDLESICKYISRTAGIDIQGDKLTD